VPLAPAFIGKENIAYRRYVIRSIQTDDEAVIIRGELVHPSGGSDELIWTIRPEIIKVGGARCVGFSYDFQFSSAQREIHQVVDRTTWGMGGVAGLEIVSQSGSIALEPLFKLTASSAIPAQWKRWVIGIGDFMFFMRGKGASLVSFALPAALEQGRIIRQPPMEEVLVEGRFAFPFSLKIKTPRRFVLLCDGWDINFWTEMRDYVARKLREGTGIQQVQPLPTLNTSKGFYRATDSFDDAVRDALPLAMKLNFKRIYLGPVWVSARTEWERLTEAQRKRAQFPSSCAPMFLDVADCYGGKDGLKKLCVEADKSGIQIIAWLATSHLSDISPLLEQHPDWIPKRKDGRPFKSGYKDITGVFHPAGYGDYALSKLLQLGRDTGLHGFWLDSYSNFGLCCIDYGSPDWRNQFREIVEFQRRLQDAGYVLLIEGHAPFGLPACNFGGVKRYIGREYMAYMTSPYWRKWAETNPTRGTYFRCLANKCAPIIPREACEEDETLAAEVKYANAAYMKLLPLMKRRLVLPDGAGVLWLDGSDEGALFAFKDGPIKTGRRLRSAAEAVSGREAKVGANGVEAKALTAYRLLFE